MWHNNEEAHGMPAAPHALVPVPDAIGHGNRRWEGAFSDPGKIEVRFDIPLAALFSAGFGLGCATDSTSLVDP